MRQLSVFACPEEVGMALRGPPESLRMEEMKETGKSLTVAAEAAWMHNYPGQEAKMEISAKVCDWVYTEL